MKKMEDVNRAFSLHKNHQRAFYRIKLMKGKALRKQSLRGKVAATVLLKLFISQNERCHTPNAL